MRKPSQKALRLAAKWLRLHVECADSTDEIMKEIATIDRVAKWLDTEGRKASTVPSFCKTCSRNTKAPLFDGCMTPNCPRGYQPCL